MCVCMCVGVCVEGVLHVILYKICDPFWENMPKRADISPLIYLYKLSGIAYLSFSFNAILAAVSTV